MKKVLALLLTIIFVTPLAGALAKTTPANTTDTPVTLEKFLSRYQEGLNEVYSMFAIKSEPFVPEFAISENGEIFFEFQSADCILRGHAYADTTVIREAYMLMPKTDASVFAGMAVIYALTIEKSIWGTDTKLVSNLGINPVKVNGYKISLIDSDVAGWYKTLGVERIDGNVSMEAVGEVKYPDELSAASKADGLSLSSGEYDVGTHIPAGEYTVTPIKSAGISVYRNGSLKTNEYLSVSDQDEIGRLVLMDGDTIEINGGKLQFSPFK